MINFSDWLLKRESSPHTRARNAAALGLLPWATVGSINGKSTASPSQITAFEKATRKRKKKKRKKN